MDIVQLIKNNWEQVAGIAGGAWVFIKGTFACYKKIKSVYYKGSEFINTVKQQGEDITEIKKNILPNGGKSLDDRIVRMSAAIKEIGVNIETIMGRQAAVIHEIPTPMYECNAKGELIDVNRAWIDLCGLDKDDALGDGWKKIIHIDDLDMVVETGDEFVESGKSYNNIFRIKNYRTKELFEVRATSTKVYDKSGNVICIIGALNLNT